MISIKHDFSGMEVNYSTYTIQYSYSNQVETGPYR